MKFIDLFAGLGGFHVGLKQNGFKCVFSCEIDESLRKLYEVNHGILPHNDIRTIKEEDIPHHDILCAGFPCQPFSLAGKKKGAKCPESGKLIDHVIRITRFHKPKFIMLENVPNILTIENGKFWKYMESSFIRMGYNIQHKIFNPVEFGMPQNRKRVFIVGIRSDISKNDFIWPSTDRTVKKNLLDILDNTLDSKPLEPAKIHLLNMWQELLNNLNMNKISSVSISAPEFGANYPEDFSQLSIQEMRQYNGAYGAQLIQCKTWGEILINLPSYARKNKCIPQWILKSTQFSRKIYKENQEICSQWINKLDKNNNSWQILEWRGESKNFSLNSHIIQFRASGIRVLKNNTAPSLISMTPTQIPIITSESRYISKIEAAKLQFLHNLKHLPEKNTAAFKALGNAVNAKIVELIGEGLKTML